VPRTRGVATAAELRGTRLRFPFAIKSDDPVGSLSATRIVENREALDAILDRLPGDEPVVVQERLGGPLLCLAMVIDRAGDVAARFQHIAHSTWPAEAGPTARAISVAPDLDLFARITRLLRAVGYWGLVQLDFLPGRHGLALVDANPRYYPALALATACGVNLPAAWHRVVVGAPAVVPPPTARACTTGGSRPTSSRPSADGPGGSCAGPEDRPRARCGTRRTRRRPPCWPRSPSRRGRRTVCGRRSRPIARIAPEPPHRARHRSAARAPASAASERIVPEPARRRGTWRSTAPKSYLYGSSPTMKSK
jgi:hypothetical protein